MQIKHLQVMQAVISPKWPQCLTDGPRWHPPIVIAKWIQTEKVGGGGAWWGWGYDTPAHPSPSYSPLSTLRPYYHHQRWYLPRPSEMVFTNTIRDGIYQHHQRWYLPTPSEMVFTITIRDGIYQHHQRWYLPRPSETVFTKPNRNGIYQHHQRWY